MKGPVGLPDVRRPDGTEAGLLGGVLRVDFDLFANVRPIRLFPNVACPLAKHDLAIGKNERDSIFTTR